jgi:hypothetical protein
MRWGTPLCYIKWVSNVTIRRASDPTSAPYNNVHPKHDIHHIGKHGPLHTVSLPSLYFISACVLIYPFLGVASRWGELGGIRRLQQNRRKPLIQGGIPFPHPNRDLPADYQVARQSDDQTACPQTCWIYHVTVRTTAFLR